MKRATLDLSEALWLAAFPTGYSEKESLQKENAERAAIEALLPEAIAEWKAVGGNPLDLWMFEASFNPLDKGSNLMQARAQDWIGNHPNEQFPQRVANLLTIVDRSLKRMDEEAYALALAEKELNKAGHNGHIKFYGRPCGMVASSLSIIESTYFRFPRQFIAAVDYANRIAPDPWQDDQRGHTEFKEVEVDSASFERWMFHTQRWAAGQALPTSSSVPISSLIDPAAAISKTEKRRRAKDPKAEAARQRRDTLLLLRAKAMRKAEQGISDREIAKRLHGKDDWSDLKEESLRKKVSPRQELSKKR